MIEIKDKIVAYNDILIAEWPSFTADNKAKASSIMKDLLVYIRAHNIKKFLIDCRNSQIEISQAEYNWIIYWFTTELMSTSLTKFARIKSQDPVREFIVNRETIPAYNTMYSIEFQEFDNFNEGCCWLNLPSV